MKGEDGAGDLQNLAVDSDGQLIVVPRGQAGNYLDVDSDGFMTAVVKGDFEGDLRTVKLDDDGRLSAYTYDPQDVWGSIISIGNAELAARLGSPVRYERSGQVILIESFEHGTQRWAYTGYGTGWAVSLDPSHAMTGGYSLKLVSGKIALGKAELKTRLGTYPAGKLGFSLKFGIDTNIGSIAFYAHIDNIAYQWTAGARWNDATEDLEYRDSAGNYVKAGDADLPGRLDHYWNTLKWVIDMELGEYTRIRFNEQTFDLTGTSFFQGTSGGTAMIDLHIILTGDASANYTAYLDDIIITAAEE